MKKILVSLAAMLVASSCYAGGDVSWSLSTQTGTTTTVVTDRIGAPGVYLDTINIKIVSGAVTGVVSLVTTNETLIDSQVVSTSTNIRPRMPIAYYSSLALVGQTNAYQKVFLVNDLLKLTWNESAPVTGSANVKIRFVLTDN